MIGDIVREARKNKKMTLSEVSDLINVTVGYLSNIEKNRQEPSLSVLRDLSEALEIHLPLLLSDNNKDEAIVIKKSETAHIKFQNLSRECNVLTPMVWRGKNPSEIDVIIVDIPSHMPVVNDDILTDTDECLYVVEGEIEYQNGNQKNRIRRGQSIFIPRKTGHLIVNPTNYNAKVMWFIPNLRRNNE